MADGFLKRALRGGIGAVLGPRLVVVLLILWAVAMTIFFALNYSSLK